MTEHVFDVKGCSVIGSRTAGAGQSGGYRIGRTTVVDRAGFVSAASRTATVTRPARRGRRTEAHRFWVTAAVVQPTGAARPASIRRALRSVCEPGSRQTRADAASIAVTSTVIAVGVTLTTGGFAPSTVFDGRHAAPVSAAHAGSATAARTASAAGRGTAVGTEEPRLEPGSQRVVTEAEDVHLRNVGITGRPPDELPVDHRLARLVGHRNVLGARVPGAAGGVDLPADLVEIETEPVDGRRLSGAGERIPRGLLDPGEVDEARVRPRIAAVERIGRGVRVGVEAEAVHERAATATRPVPGAEGCEEADG